MAYGDQPEADRLRRIHSSEEVLMTIDVDPGSIIPDAWARLLVATFDDGNWLGELRRQVRADHEAAHAAWVEALPWWRRWWHTATGHR